MIEVYDVTLRDGTQCKDVNLTIHDKLEIVNLLDNIGVDYIELGWPGSNQIDKEVFEQAKKLKLKHAKIAAFGSTKRVNTPASNDANLKALLDSKAEVCTIFGKTIKDHVIKQLKCSLEENLKCIEETIKHLKDHKRTVFFDAEHFFDGFKDDEEYALKCLETAINAGADNIVLCDTNGGFLPNEIRTTCDKVLAHLASKGKNIPVGIHCHNDSGCGVANSLAAIQSGIQQVQVSINGVGERTGNADLCQVVPNLMLKLNHKTNVKLDKITGLSTTFDILANLKPNNSKPFVGKNAFSHKGGIHIDAVLKGASYEHINPELVGNNQDIVLSDLSGKSSIVNLANKFGVKIDKNNPKVDAMLKKVEEMEKQGYNIGSIDAEKKLLVNRYLKDGKDKLNIETWRIMSEFRHGEHSECVITGEIDGKKKEVVAPVEGGPVNATFHALRKFVATKYEKIENVKLTNYKVMIAEDMGSGSSVRVYIEFTNGKGSWQTIGVSTNILEASLEAIKKAFEYYLI